MCAPHPLLASYRTGLYLQVPTSLTRVDGHLQLGVRTVPACEASLGELLAAWRAEERGDPTRREALGRLIKAALVRETGVDQPLDGHARLLWPEGFEDAAQILATTDDGGETCCCP